jgi:thymidine kinase
MALHITLGCMYASKTTSLIEKTKELENNTYFVLDYDTSRSGLVYEGILTNHEGISIPCIKCSHLYDVLDIYKKQNNFQFSHEFDTRDEYITSPEMYETRNKILKSTIILINEAQFYPDLVEFVKEYHTKTIYVYGLDGDFKQNKIGNILDLIPFCDTVTKLTAKCSCSKPAIFSKRLSNETDQYQPNATYVPVCRNCL